MYTAGHRKYISVIFCLSLAACTNDSSSYDASSDEGEDEAVALHREALCVPGLEECDDQILNPIYPDHRHETGHFTGDGVCEAYWDTNYSGERQTLGMRRVFLYVGSHFNDEISSFRVPFGCHIVAWDDANRSGDMTTFSSDTDYVGDDWNDRISSYACRCP